MRGKTAKLIRKFANDSWEHTPENDRVGTLRRFIKNMKREWNRNPTFKKYVTNLREDLK